MLRRAEVNSRGHPELLQGYDVCEGEAGALENYQQPGGMDCSVFESWLRQGA